MLNETKLFISVIVQGLLDALNLFYDDRKINSKHHREATYWLVHKDFKYVCDLANLQPDYVLFIYAQLKKHDQNITYDQTKEILYETFTRQQ